MSDLPTPGYVLAHHASPYFVPRLQTVEGEWVMDAPSTCHPSASEPCTSSSWARAPEKQAQQPCFPNRGLGPSWWVGTQFSGGSWHFGAQLRGSDAALPHL